jgi:hypothetical protein
MNDTIFYILLFTFLYFCISEIMPYGLRLDSIRPQFTSDDFMSTFNKFKHIRRKYLLISYLCQIATFLIFGAWSLAILFFVFVCDSVYQLFKYNQFADREGTSYSDLYDE